MSNTDTQKAMIKSWLKRHRTITPLDAIKFIGCTKLSTRCSEMIRDGEPIKKKPVTVKNRFGKDVRVMSYSL